MGLVMHFTTKSLTNISEFTGLTESIYALPYTVSVPQGSVFGPSVVLYSRELYFSSVITLLSFSFFAMHHISLFFGLLHIFKNNGKPGTAVHHCISN